MLALLPKAGSTFARLHRLERRTGIHRQPENRCEAQPASLFRPGQPTVASHASGIGMGGAWCDDMPKSNLRSLTLAR